MLANASNACVMIALITLRIEFTIHNNEATTMLNHDLTLPMQAHHARAVARLLTEGVLE